MWRLAPTTTWQKDVKWYEKKRPNELAVVLHNLERYRHQLNAAKNSKAVMAGYLHQEPKGAVAVDQKGGGANLQETRLYTYADDENRVLHLITIGDKDAQAGDIQFCNDFVDTLLTQRELKHEHRSSEQG
jgi:hypothetical protein